MCYWCEITEKEKPYKTMRPWLFCEKAEKEVSELFNRARAQTPSNPTATESDSKQQT